MSDKETNSCVDVDKGTELLRDKWLQCLASVHYSNTAAT